MMEIVWGTNKRDKIIFILWQNEKVNPVLYQLFFKKKTISFHTIWNKDKETLTLFPVF